MRNRCTSYWIRAPKVLYIRSGSALIHSFQQQTTNALHMCDNITSNSTAVAAAEKDTKLSTQFWAGYYSYNTYILGPS